MNADGNDSGLILDVVVLVLLVSWSLKLRQELTKSPSLCGSSRQVESQIAPGIDRVTFQLRCFAPVGVSGVCYAGRVSVAGSTLVIHVSLNLRTPAPDNVSEDMFW